MTNESMNRENEQPTGDARPESTSQPEGASQPEHGQIVVEQTPVERVASTVYTQAGEAADAFRRGELMQDSEVDALADSDDRLIALLSYVTQLLLPVIMPLIVLLSESSKKRPFQRYHAVQSLTLALLFWLTFFAGSVAIGIIQIIPLLGWLIGAFAVLCLVPMYFVGGIGLMLYYGLQAYKGRRFAIPGLTSFLRDQNWLA